MSRFFLVAATMVSLAGCAGVFAPTAPDAPVLDGSDAALRPAARPDAGAPPADARTVEEFDTTTAEDRATAQAGSAGAGARLGSTIASLGSPSETGFWLKTPLVDEVREGRVEYPANGTSVALELRPLDGDAGAGSQISLAAMRLLEAPLTGLPELIVYAE